MIGEALSHGPMPGSISDAVAWTIVLTLLVSFMVVL